MVVCASPPPPHFKPRPGCSKDVLEHNPSYTNWGLKKKKKQPQNPTGTKQKTTILFCSSVALGAESGGKKASLLFFSDFSLPIFPRTPLTQTGPRRQSQSTKQSPPKPLPRNRRGGVLFPFFFCVFPETAPTSPPPVALQYRSGKCPWVFVPPPPQIRPIFTIPPHTWAKSFPICSKMSGAPTIERGRKRVFRGFKSKIFFKFWPPNGPPLSPPGPPPYPAPPKTTDSNFEVFGQQHQPLPLFQK